MVGALLDVHALASAGPALLPLLAVTAATVVLSLGAGWLLARQSGLDLATASLGMVAGGSAAVIGAAKDLGADSRMVAFMQYLRLILIVLTTPVVVSLVFRPASAHVQAHTQAGMPLAAVAAGYLFLLWAAPLGYVLGKVLRLPAPAFISPVLAGALATVVGIGHQPPADAREMAFTVIGLEVGLRLNLSSLRTMGRMLPMVLAYVVGLTAACSGLSYLVTLVAPISPLNAFLATTPGGINAVLAEASSVTGSNLALISTVQTMRLFAMVLLVPPLLRWLLSRPPQVKSSRPPRLPPAKRRPQGQWGLDHCTQRPPRWRTVPQGAAGSRWQRRWAPQQDPPFTCTDGPGKQSASLGRTPRTDVPRGHPCPVRAKGGKDQYLRAGIEHACDSVAHCLDVRDPGMRFRLRTRWAC